MQLLQKFHKMFSKLLAVGTLMVFKINIAALLNPSNNFFCILMPVEGVFRRGHHQGGDPSSRDDERRVGTGQILRTP